MMPVVKAPLPKFSDFPKLRKMKAVVADIRERIQLYVDEKAIATALKGKTEKRDGKKVKLPGLNYKLFATLRHAIPDADVKSFEFDISDEDTDDAKYVGRYQVSMLAYENGRKSLDKEALITTPWKVEIECPHCHKEFREKVLLPPKMLEAAMKEGEVPEPTISVKRISSNGDGDEDGDE